MHIHDVELVYSVEFDDDETPTVVGGQQDARYEVSDVTVRVIPDGDDDGGDFIDVQAWGYKLTKAGDRSLSSPTRSRIFGFSNSLTRLEQRVKDFVMKSHYAALGDDEES